MNGKRVVWHAQIPNPGEYMKLPGGMFHARTPNGHLANLERHKITEHENGTITVVPSIAVGLRHDKDGKMVPPYLYHGFLENGVWRSAGDESSWELLPESERPPEEPWTIRTGDLDPEEGGAALALGDWLKPLYETIKEKLPAGTHFALIIDIPGVNGGEGRIASMSTERTHMAPLAVQWALTVPQAGDEG